METIVLAGVQRNFDWSLTKFTHFASPQAATIYKYITLDSSFVSLDCRNSAFVFQNFLNRAVFNDSHPWKLNTIMSHREKDEIIARNTFLLNLRD
jgi:hypothetical protein